ncbi:MAG: DNA polymerase III subunit gamma/tau [Prevotellaceae bacterium]|jgi:DNA polymerase-3 subunit gamma/tau|nr:DNA polymerase III subunit gamma/tau [Prevotellaceae bacterium]
MEQFVVSAIKYRPLSFASVVGQSTIGATLKNAIQRGHLSHAYLFCGPRGVGKTTCARIFAKTINCLNPGSDMEACGECESCRSFSEGRSYCIHELDAASNNSVDDIRTLVEQVRVPPQIGKYSVYIIDEVHMLSSAAFNAFLKTLEEPPSYAIFILATTEKHKIIPTILSRCQIYDFNRIRVNDIVSHLKDIAQKEGVTCEPDALNIIARKADGAMRDALSIFDRVVSFCGNNVSYSAVIEDLNVLDYEYYFRLTDAIRTHNYVEAYMIFDEILKKGFDAQHFVSGLSSHFRDILMCKDARTLSLLEVGEVVAERYRQQAAECSVDFMLDAMNITNKCETEYKSSGNPRLLIELTLLNLSYIGTEKKNSPQEHSEQSAVKPETKTESAAVQKKTEPEPAPVPEAPKVVISLKDMLKAKTESETKTISEVPEIVEEKTFTEERLVQEWRAYAEKIKAQLPRLSSRLLEYSPKLVSENLVHYPIISEQHRELMETRTTELISHLRETLNASITVEWVVQEAPADEGKPRLYTMKDKISYIASTNSAIEGIIKDLDLDYR